MFNGWYQMYFLRAGRVFHRHPGVRGEGSRAAGQDHRVGSLPDPAHLWKNKTRMTTLSDNSNIGSREEDEVSGFFVLSHLGMRGYFRLG